MFELIALLDQLISYSHGMKQTLALIAALLHEPEQLILDELISLDPKGAYYFKQIMRESQASQVGM